MSVNGLIEIGCEELPVSAQQSSCIQLKHIFEQGLQEARLSVSSIQTYATPRRLVVQLTSIAAQQQAKTVELLGPKLTQAFDDQQSPTPAGMGFARRCGVPIESLQTTGQGEEQRLIFQSTRPGLPASELLLTLVPELLAKLPISKPMRWGAADHAFYRPVRWCVGLIGEQLLPFTFMGCQAGRLTYGHRLMAPGPIELSTCQDFAQQLQSGWVMLGAEHRRQVIEQQAKTLLPSGYRVELPSGLLDEVAGLVEWPQCYLGEFDTRYCQLDAQILSMALAVHLKSFMVYRDDGRVSNRFIVVSNRVNESAELIVSGYERVVNARLADALFFFQQDRQQALHEHAKRLDCLVFEAGLGSVADKISRMQRLAVWLAGQMGRSIDPIQRERAIALLKADLVTQMVGEFPKLQGVMGRQYAQHDGEAEPVSLAIEQHYWPRYAGDDCPQQPLAVLCALVDKLDSLAGFFSRGKAPTGERDPYGLRRQALGVIRIIISTGLTIDLKQFITEACSHFPMPDPDKGVDELLGFFHARMRAWYREQLGRSDCFDAVLPIAPYNLVALDQQIRWLAHTSLADDCELMQGYKRIYQCVKKHLDHGLPLKPELLTQTSEKDFYRLWQEVDRAVTTNIQACNYQEAAAALATFRTTVDHFFEEVLVFDANEAIKNNRLALLISAINSYHQLAVFSALSG